MEAEQIIKKEITSRLVKKEGHLIGVEIECLVYDMENRRLPVERPGAYNSLALVSDLINLRNPNNIEDIYSLEPGGQLEWASQPARSLTMIQKQFDDHLRRLRTILGRKNLFSIDFSLDPLYLPEEVDLVSQKKYVQMDRMFTDTGNHGRWMMRNSTSTQVNIDYSSIEEAEEMAFLADCLQPLASILFSNTPFILRKKTGNSNYRYKVWLDTDPARCGSLLSHGVEKKEGLLDRFCEIVLKAPLVFTRDEQDNIGSFNGTARDWICSAQDGISDTVLARTALQQIFTHVRFKRVIEIRGCDRPPFGYELAPAAFWSGILINRETRKDALNAVEKWSRNERIALEKAAVSIDIGQAGPGGRTIFDWINRFTDLAIRGLKARSKRTGMDEKLFLEPFLEKYRQYGPPGKFYQEKFATVEDMFECYKKGKPEVDCGWMTR